MGLKAVDFATTSCEFEPRGKGSDATPDCKGLLRPMDDLTRAQALRSPPSNLKPRRQSSTLRAQSLVFAGMEAHRRHRRFRARPNGS